MLRLVLSQTLREQEAEAALCICAEEGLFLGWSCRCLW